MLPSSAGLQEHILVKVKVARLLPRGEVKDLRGHSYPQGAMPGRSLKGKLLIPWELVWLSVLLQVTVGGADLQTTGPHSVHLRSHRLSQVSPRRPPDPSLGLDFLPSNPRMRPEDRPLSPPPQSGDGGGDGKGIGKGKGDGKGKGKGKAWGCQRVSVNHCLVRREGETTDFALVQSSMTLLGLPSVNETTG